MNNKNRPEKRRAFETNSCLHLLVRRNIRCARRKWELSRDHIDMLKALTAELEL
jgi:hypothetical protein